jgi:CBS domain-containing protein
LASPFARADASNGTGAEAKEDIAMTVHDILQTKGAQVVSVAPGDTVGNVARVLNDRRIGAVLVREDGKVVGVFSERDVVRGLARYGAQALDRLVSDLMTHDVVTCKPNDTVHDVMERMTARRIRHLPVLENGQLKGIVSIGDLVKARIEEAEREAQDLREYIKAG